MGGVGSAPAQSENEVEVDPRVKGRVIHIVGDHNAAAGGLDNFKLSVV